MFDGNPPPRPIPPQIRRVCDCCWKPAGTCWCRTFHAVMSVAIFLGIITAYTLIWAANAHGQIMNDPTPAVAVKNAKWLNSKLPNIKLPAGTLYVDGTATTKAVVGCGKYSTDGSRSYPVDNHPTLTGSITRIVQLGKGPIFRITGHGFYATDPIELVGDKQSAAIEICSGDGPATGGHSFANITFQNWGAAFKACGNETNPDADAHADDTIVTNCRSFNCRAFFRSENQQAVNWKLRDCSVCGLGEDDKSVIVADLKRGGNITIDGLMILHHYCTIFKLGDYSPNTRRLICRDFWRDRMIAPDHYLTLVAKEGDGAGQIWDITVSGNVPTHDAPPLDESKLFRVPNNLSRDLWDTSGVRVIR